jgi:hypothetical protein
MEKKRVKKNLKKSKTFGNPPKVSKNKAKKASGRSNSSKEKKGKTSRRIVAAKNRVKAESKRKNLKRGHTAEGKNASIAEAHRRQDGLASTLDEETSMAEDEKFESRLSADESESYGFEDDAGDGFDDDYDDLDGDLDTDYTDDDSDSLDDDELDEFEDYDDDLDDLKESFRSYDE